MNIKILTFDRSIDCRHLHFTKKSIIGINQPIRAHITDTTAV